MSSREELLEKSFEAFHDLIFIVSHDGTYLDFFGNRENLYISPEEFMVKKIIDIIPKEIAKLQMDTINKAFKTKKTLTLELELQYKKKLNIWNLAILFIPKT
ncbi:hypothetical protein LCGC14_0751200 [marine sediment metagenome]|uniref:PAS domain-containing protein n=1 Tax=marine sediment metagenome TaxID=412755 RepID=A0A0F9Q3V5_9ZZZZ|nr:MAG: hypothetical protein Lokiarch_29570 [Candidatus Lokiarchaeum sp. GC14_75]HEC39639.1 hypothetical protein [bacterium]